MKEMPHVPSAECQCSFQLSFQGHCICGQTEKALRAWSDRKMEKKMTAVQREWCYAEIDKTEGYDSRDYFGAPDRLLAAAVLACWVDYCRDKGLL